LGTERKLIESGASGTTLQKEEKTNPNEEGLARKDGKKKNNETRDKSQRTTLEKERGSGVSRENRRNKGELIGITSHWP